jgi:hypothetical protein
VIPPECRGVKLSPRDSSSDDYNPQSVLDPPDPTPNAAACGRVPYTWLFVDHARGDDDPGEGERDPVRRKHQWILTVLWDRSASAAAC